MRGNLPLYTQLKNTLIEYIETELKEDDQIISENEMMLKYNVSRTTVRKALKELKEEGLVYQKQGLGTFVKAKDNVHQLGVYTGFSTRMKTMGLNIAYTLNSEQILSANKAIAQHLQIPEKEKVFHLERTGSNGGVPLNLTYSYIPYRYVESIESFRFDQNSLYNVLREEFGIYITRTVKHIEAILTDYEKAEKLSVSEGIPILKFDGFVYARNEDGKEFLLEYFREYYRTDNTQFSLEECANI